MWAFGPHYLHLVSKSLVFRSIFVSYIVFPRNTWPMSVFCLMITLIFYQDYCTVLEKSTI